MRTSCAASGETAAGQSRLDATEAFSTFPAILLLQHTSSMTLLCCPAGMVTKGVDLCVPPINFHTNFLSGRNYCCPAHMVTKAIDRADTDINFQVRKMGNILLPLVFEKELQGKLNI